MQGVFVGQLEVLLGTADLADVWQLVGGFFRFVASSRFWDFAFVEIYDSFVRLVERFVETRVVQIAFAFFLRFEAFV